MYLLRSSAEPRNRGLGNGTTVPHFPVVPVPQIPQRDRPHTTYIHNYLFIKAIFLLLTKIVFLKSPISLNSCSLYIFHVEGFFYELLFHVDEKSYST